MKFGYARVSTTGQKLEVQFQELEKRGADKIFSEKVSGKSTENRNEFKRMLEQLREGDTVIVYKLDRLGRNMRDLVNLMEDFKEKGIHFVSIQDGIDTSTPTGKFMFNILASVAEMERELILERTAKGREVARARGKLGGRKKKKNTKQIERILEDYQKQELTVEELCSLHEVSRATLFRYVKQNEQSEQVAVH